MTRFFIQPYRLIKLGLLLIGMLGTLWANAAEFRTFQAIFTPNTELPENARIISPVRPLPPIVVEAYLKKMFAAYNTPNLENFLGDDFTDKQRLTEVVSDVVPRDAKMQFLSMLAPQTISQYLVVDRTKGKVTIISKVAVIARARMEFNDAVQGFQQIESQTEYVFDFKETYTP